VLVIGHASCSVWADGHNTTPGLTVLPCCSLSPNPPPPPLLSLPCCCCPALPCWCQGVVTHVTDVKPLASVITYTDSEHGVEVSAGGGGGGWPAAAAGRGGEAC
jgi:hypothetical protein